MTLWSLVLITSFGPWALPQMVQKFYSIRSKADVHRAMLIATVFALFAAESEARFCSTVAATVAATVVATLTAVKIIGIAGMLLPVSPDPSSVDFEAALRRVGGRSLGTSHTPAST